MLLISKSGFGGVLIRDLFENKMCFYSFAFQFFQGGKGMIHIKYLRALHGVRIFTFTIVKITLSYT